MKNPFKKAAKTLVKTVAKVAPQATKIVTKSTSKPIFKKGAGAVAAGAGALVGAAGYITHKKKTGGVSTGPGFIDKVQLAAKRIGRNITNRRAVNLDNKSSKLYNTNREKSDNLYAKAESLYDKASDKNNKIKAFKKSEGFKPGGDGTQTGGVSYKKPGKIFSNFKSGGTSSAFAKLAPPYNKATFADKIAGAKKKK
jgi:hypothetical protein